MRFCDHRKSLVELCLLVGMTLSACNSGLGILTPEPHVIGQQIPTYTTEALISMIEEQGYLDGCRALGVPSVLAQINYKGIYPGQTTTSEVQGLVGLPSEIHSVGQGDFEEWLYEDFSIMISKDNGRVFSMVIVDEMLLIPLDDIVRQHGCPTVVFAYDGNEEPSGHFNSTLFVYLEGGIEYAFSAYPPTNSSTPQSIRLFIPGNIESYLSEELWLHDPNCAKIIDWGEIVFP